MKEMKQIREKLELELRVNQSMVDQLSNDNIFKIEYKAKVKAIKEVLEILNEEPITIEESIEKDIYNMSNDDCEYEMWLLGELNKECKGGTQPWDL